MSQGGITISLGENYISAQLSGVYPNDAAISKREMRYGRFINDIDMREMRKVLVVSEDQAKELLPHQPKNLIGQHVNVSGIAFNVVGILKADQSRMSSEVFTAFTTLRSMYNRGDRVGTLQFSFHGLNSMKQNEEFEAQYRARSRCGYGTVLHKTCR